MPLPQDLVMHALAPALSTAGVKRLAVSVDEDDDAAKEVWQGYGFTPLKPVDLRRMAWQLPNFAKEATDGTVYYSLDL